MTARLLALSLSALTACAARQDAPVKASATSVHARSQRPRGQDSSERDAFRKAVAAAEKRAATDPIEIVVCDAGVDEKVGGALDPRAAVDAIARALWEEPLFRVRAVRVARDNGPMRADGCAEAAELRGFAPDVWVFAKAELDDPVERIRSTGNLLSGQTLTVRVEISSAYGTGRSATCASGSVADPLTVVTDAARAASIAILSDIAPKLPSRASLAGLRREAAPEPVSDATATTLRRLFAQR